MRASAKLPEVRGRTTRAVLGTRPGDPVGAALPRRRFESARLAARAGLSRPQSFAELLDQALETLAATFTPCFLVSVLLWFPLLYLRSALDRSASDEFALVFTLAAPGLVGVLALVFICGVVGAHLVGRPLGFQQALFGALGRAPGMILVAMATNLAVAFGCCCFGVPGIALAWCLAVVAPVYALEGVSVPAALKRSVKLSATPATFLRWLGCAVFGFLLLLPLRGLQFFLESPELRTSLQEYLGVRGGSLDLVVAALGTPLFALASAFDAVLRTVYYFDLRVRREGLDLGLALAAAPSAGA